MTAAIAVDPCSRCGLTDECRCNTPMTGDTIGEAQIVWATAFVMEWPYLTRDAAILLRSVALPNVYDTDHKRRELARQACAEIHNARLTARPTMPAEAFLRTLYRLQIGRPQPVEYETAKSLAEFASSHGIRAWYEEGKLKAEWTR